MAYAVKVDHVSKKFRKGQTSYHTLREDLYDLTGRLVHLRKNRSDDDVRHIWALKDVSFEVQPGERVGIIGRNGSGKTTLLRLLSGITQPTQGKISVRGRLGVIIELMAGFHPELTGRENVYLNGAIMGMSQKEIRRKFDEIVAFAELEQFIDTPIKRYSSGMHVRLGFAVAAHLDPDVLLVDEVLAVGDAAFQSKCLEKMQGAASEGRTVLFVSHNMATVAGLCDRCMLLDRGQLRADGPSGETIEEYLRSSHSAKADGIPGNHDLTGRENPYLPGTLIVRRLQILNSRGLAQDGFLMGQEMTLAIDVEGMSDHQDALIGVIFRSEGGQRVTAINTGMTCGHVDEPRRHHETALLHIPGLPFMPGSYWIDLSVTRGRTGQRLEYVDRAAQLQVVEADVYGSGYNLVGDYGTIYLNATWEIRGRE